MVLLQHPVKGQANTDPTVHPGMTLQLKGDTLYTDTDLKFFVGQKLVIGNPSGDDGFYRAVIYKNAALVPSIWGQDMRYDNAIENHVNKKKSREKVKSSFVPGNSVTITHITYLKTAKPYFYLVSLEYDGDRYNCDLRLALVLKELSSAAPGDIK